ncbi:MAG: SpoIIE family protein phosphatase [Verrucomicrobia bacterium]|nr:SpoIIE family protein phosphatase [Verrucomicrobiota bacterium]
MNGAAQSSAPPLPATPAPVPGSAPIRVLLVEDNPGDARLIRAMLKAADGDGFQVERADRLLTGLEQMAAGRIDVVLLDLSLPDSQGLDTFTRASATAPKVPIIVMSGSADETLAVHAVQAGAQDYLVKGHVDSHGLGRAIRYAIERQRTAEQLARYAEELRQKNVQMEADMNMAREIQQAFLPEKYPTFPPGVAPAASRLRFCHRYLPATAVSGDFFDIFPLSDAEAGVLICDVIGHGLRAALVTAIMRGLVQELMPTAPDAGRFLAGLNHGLRAIFQRMNEPLVATAFYLIADAGRDELRFASAGHPSPLRVRRAAGVVEPLRTQDPRHGPGLGLFDEAAYPTCRCAFAEKDLVILFTDGLYEIEGAEGGEFGLDRLCAAVQRRVHLPPAQLFDELLEEAQSFSGRKEFADGVCLVAVERSETQR